ncbi:MAG: hypothetical protein HYU28_09365 [Actinobacteria bacterium]|nr:hypothetical protein [Actinomycetota bacterium]
MTRRLFAAGLALAAVALSLVVAGPSHAAFEREFRARARAFPVEPDPGQNQTSFSFRAVAVEGGLASAPMGANGRAAVIDLGFIENQSVNGNPIAPEESYARCDSVSPNVPDDQERTVGPVALSATCAASPSLDVRADGVSPAAFVPASALEALGVSEGTISSHITADASGSAVIAEAVSELAGLDVGPLHIESLRFRARAATTGEAGGASVEWSVDGVDADVNGVPVTIGTGGVDVDDQQVPLPLVPQATAAVQEAFAQSGGFIDVRILEPQRSAADDGSSAEVKGGGFHIFLARSADPTDREYLGLTLLGGHVRVDAGEPRSGGFSLQPFTSGAARVGGVQVIDSAADGFEAPLAPRRTRSSPAQDVAAPAPEPAPARVSFATSTASRSLPQPSSWWLAALVAGLAVLALAAASTRPGLLPARRRAEGWWDATSERFFRG